MSGVISLTAALEYAQRDWHVFPARIKNGSKCSHVAGLKNPGALAGATGAMQIELAFKTEDYRKPGRNAMSLYAKDRHKRAVKMLGYALTDPATWAATGAVWAVRLTTNELASLAYTALRALDPEAREMTFNAAHWGEM